MEKHILFMPDGNRRYAKKEGISLKEAYLKGAKSLKLLSDFFLIEHGWSWLTMHIMSKYSHERNDGSLKPIYEAIIHEFTALYNSNYFVQNNIKFKWIDHSNKIPASIVEICEALSKQTKLGEKTSLNLLGYDLETDEQNAFQNATHYQDFKEKKLISNIDLVLRTTEMRTSKGPIYAMSQAQMLLINKLNPELTKKDLGNILKQYEELMKYRKTTNPIHK